MVFLRRWSLFSFKSLTVLLQQCDIVGLQGAFLRPTSAVLRRAGQQVLICSIAKSSNGRLAAQCTEACLMATCSRLATLTEHGCFVDCSCCTSLAGLQQSCAAVIEDN